MIIGVDPGKHGAICALHRSGIIDFYDIPTYDVQAGSGKNRHTVHEYNTVVLSNIIASIKGAAIMGEDITVVVEKVSGMNMGGRKDTPHTAFELGRGYGILEGIFSAHGIPITYSPRPDVWKRALGIADSQMDYREKKELARQTAIVLYPQCRKQLKLVKDTDKAEALLMCHWAIKKHGVK